MQQVVLGIKNDEKAKFLLDFLRQLDFIEILQGIKAKDSYDKELVDKKSLETTLLNAPVLSDDEIENIENIGKEFDLWKIKEF